MSSETGSGAKTQGRRSAKSRFRKRISCHFAEDIEGANKARAGRQAANE
jgi:hypothetical protein